jgi:hypothetical protein
MQPGHRHLPRPRAVAVPFALVALAAMPARSPAQVVMGELVEQETGAPIAGAFVFLMDLQGQRLGGTMTRPDGRFRLEARRAGQYLLRAERMGYVTALSDTLDLVPGDAVPYRFAIPVRPFALDEIRAEADRRCLVRPEQGLAMAQVWEEASKAFRAAAVTEREELYIYVARYRSQQLHPRNLDVQEGEEWEQVLVGRVPFISLEPAEMVEQGFVHPDGDQLVYYAPDTDLLLSDAFLDIHCLRLAGSPRDRPGWIGVEFEPIPGRDLPGIAGAVWLDVATSELRRLEYRYVGRLPVRAGRRHAGGMVSFQRLPTGAWIVRDWWIRIPVVQLQRRSERLVHYRLRGAAVMEVRDREGRLVSAW